jgi:transcriptional regulator with XRE-family HTH domain
MTGIELRALRERLGLTQQQLADRLGMSRSQIIDYESGTKRGTGRPVVISRVVELALSKIEETAERARERKP